MEPEEGKKYQGDYEGRYTFTKTEKKKILQKSDSTRPGPVQRHMFCQLVNGTFGSQSTYLIHSTFTHP